MNVIKFKLCPRCHGDLCLGQDIFGMYYSCLQCGYLQDVEDARPASPLTVVTEHQEELRAA